MSMLSITFGLPAFPIPAIFPSFIPMSVFIIPCIGSRSIALVMTRSTESSLFTPLACPSPSLALFPPPKTSSSPYVSRSFSTSMTKSVSPSLILSPVVGPNNSTYLCLGISSEDLVCSVFSSELLKPFSFNFLTAFSFSDFNSPLTRPLKP